MKLDALREFLSHHLTQRGLGDVESYLERFAKLESENDALRKGHWRQLAETDYCYVCDGHGHSHADDCVLTGGDELRVNYEMNESGVCVYCEEDEDE